MFNRRIRVFRLFMLEVEANYQRTVDATDLFEERYDFF